MRIWPWSKLYSLKRTVRYLLKDGRCLREEIKRLQAKGKAK